MTGSRARRAAPCNLLNESTSARGVSSLNLIVGARFTGSEIVRALLPSLRVTIERNRSIRRAFVLGAAMLLAGCIDVKVPQYQRPDTPEKTAYTKMDTVKVAASDTIRPDWWRQFQDPYLDSLVDRAIASNFDIMVLAARIKVAGAQIGEARAGALPSMDLGAGASFEKTTGQMFTKQYNLGTQVNWDIDI